MNDPELLKLARHARNALCVIAASSVIVAIAALASLVPPLAEAIRWLAGDTTRAVTTVAVVGAFATLAIVIWAITKDTPNEPASVARD